MESVIIRPGANFRLHNFVLEKVVLMFVVAFPFPMLGSHLPQQKGHNVLTRQRGDIQGVRRVWGKKKKKKERERRFTPEGSVLIGAAQFDPAPITAQ